MPIQFHPHGILRDNVAALLLRADGCVLWGECADKPAWWSFPQGGVSRNETRREALMRELREETGIAKSWYRILASRGGYRYEYPTGKLKKGIYRGQIQTYFLCQLRPKAPTPHASQRKKRQPEFLQLAWVKPSEIDLQFVPPFKRHVTRQVIADFFGIDLPMPPEA